MPDTYFNGHFPTVIYNNQPVVDITRRAVIANTSLNNPFLFYPFTNSAGIRSDQLARNLYGDPYQEWVIFLSNQIIDPYNQWYMDQYQFNDYLTQKYGNVPITTQTVMYYKNNWENGANIAVNTFDSLDPVLQKYYEPTLDGFGLIDGYIRTQQDWLINTNHVVSFNFSNTIPAFIDNEIVSIEYTPSNVGSGQVALSSNNVLNIQHVSGYYLPNGSVNAASFSITGSQSNSVITLANNTVTINSYDNLVNEEEAFYSPVYVYDWEDQKNEGNKIMNVMLPDFVSNASRELEEVLN